MTAYLDESGTHGASAATQVLAGFIATEQGWQAYERDLAALLAQHHVEYFHAIKFRKRQGPFKHFNVATQAIFIHDFFELVHRHLAYGFAVSLTQKDFLGIYRAAKDALPKRFRHDSQYGVCFRFCMSAIQTFMKGQPNECPVTVVLEGGHKNSGDALRVFGDAKAEMERNEKDTTFASMFIETKKNSLPLAAADALAHSLFRSKSTGILIPGVKRSSGVVMDDVVPRSAFREASEPPRIQHFSLNAEQLAAVVQMYIEHETRP
ncbi:hypothetical protein A6X20_17490 [Bradyrhizobium elkanii]|nr:DUF3800 domain-containing protein [Bradyrhizobium elkanii]ODM82237.1 hypothetical protein A6X20_17490 [Bradyrhizobium elkanii]